MKVRVRGLDGAEEGADEAEELRPGMMSMVGLGSYPRTLTSAPGLDVLKLAASCCMMEMRILVSKVTLFRKLTPFRDGGILRRSMRRKNPEKIKRILSDEWAESILTLTTV